MSDNQTPDQSPDDNLEQEFAATEDFREMGNETGDAVEQSADEALRAEAAEAEQRALRAQAELENFRKRTQRLMDEERRYAVLPLLRDLLPILDNLSRAVSAAGEEQASQGILQGVEMVCSQVDQLLGQYKCEKIEPLGMKFDPQLHEAVGQQPHDEVPAGDICLVMQIGYQLHDRVIRPAQVFVSTGPANPAGAE